MYMKKHQKEKVLFGAITLASFIFLSGTVSALNPGTLPTGGKITSGKGSIAKNGNQMTVKQSTPKMIADWSTFNIGGNARVTVKQPSSSAMALNRIYDGNPSQILGKLSANGNIYLINPSGIVFGEGAQVNVGGLVASSLNISNKDFLTGKYIFTNNGYAESVINKGNISIIPGGVAALIAPTVINEGTITATSGDVILAAGNQVTLDFNGDGLISYTINKGAIDALAENKGLIRADGGLVVLTSKAADSLTKAVVNNSGVIEAQTLRGEGGRILLLSDGDNGRTIVGGKLDASAPNGGNGGFIETSAENVKVNGDTIVTTLAPEGTTGTWSIDPVDFKIDSLANGGDMTGATLSGLLGSNYTVLSADGKAGTEGNIYVNEAVSWSANTTLTLSAYNNVNINANITANGDTAGLTITPNTGGVGGSYYLNNGAVITLSGLTPSLSIAGNAYTVINNITALQAMGLSGYYALGSNIDATATSTWNSGAGFAPIGNASTHFTGTFDGQNHTISNLYINRPLSSQNYVGLFGYTGSGSSVSNVGLIGGSVSGYNLVGSLVGGNYGSITNTYATGSVSGSCDQIGGLVGFNGGPLTNSYTTVSVSGTGANRVGGLVGMNANNITNTYATGVVSGDSQVGGLVGRNDYGSVTNSYATGSVTGNSYAGGLLGVNFQSTVTNSFWDKDTTGQDHSSGSDDSYGKTTAQMMTKSTFNAVWDFTDTTGTWWMVDGNTRPFLQMEYSTNIINAHQLQLMAMNLDADYTLGANIDMSELTNPSGMWNTTKGFVPMGSKSTPFTGTFNGQSHTISNLTINRPAQDYVGLFGYIGSGGNVSNVGLVGGSVSGGWNVGSLVGYNKGAISDSYAKVRVIGNYGVGGLIGWNDEGTIKTSYATGSVSSTGDVGGLLGGNYLGTIENVYATGDISGKYAVGGLVGFNYGDISYTYATGSVSGSCDVGGLVGSNYDTVLASFWDTDTSGTTTGIGDGNTSGAEGKTTTEMKTASTYTGWDTDIWNVVDGSYPALK